MRKLSSTINVDNSDPSNYPDGRIKNNTGTGNGTPVNETVYGDIHQMIAKLMRLNAITENGLPDNETNGFQIIEALRALASKNDFVIPLTVNTGILSVPIKIGFMLENEEVICKAGFNLAAETKIKGTDNTLFTLTINGNFKTNEHVKLIKTSSGVTLVRMADHFSLDSMTGSLNYLKKATEAEENAGEIDTKATTPLTNLLAFILRVNGADSDNYLATDLINGIYPKEHFEIVEDLFKVKNIGYFTGYNTGAGSGISYTVGGNIVSAVSQTVTEDRNSTILCTMANAMDNTNYKVAVTIKSLGDINTDNNCGAFVFKPISTTTFQISNYKLTDDTQNLEIHMEVKQL
jgi:hypothetical protein